MLRATSNVLIVPPFECAWLSLQDYQLEGAFCLQFDCKGENDVTIILKPVPGAKRWQHLQRQQGVAGGETLAIEENYTVILGSHRNSKLKIEKNGDEKAAASGLPGCTADAQHFTTVWINYTPGVVTVGTGPPGTSITYQWRDSRQTIPNIRHIGLSCWDKHVSYRNVQLLPPVPAAQLQEQLLLLHEQSTQSQHTQQDEASHIQPQNSAGDVALDTPTSCSPFSGRHQQGQHLQERSNTAVPPLLHLVQESIQHSLTPSSTLFQVLQLSGLLLPRTQQLYDAAVQLAGSWLGLLVKQHLDDLASLSLDVLADILQEPLLDVSELSVFQAVAAWCQLNAAAVAQAELTHQHGPAITQDTAASASCKHHQQPQQQEDDDSYNVFQQGGLQQVKKQQEQQQNKQQEQQQAPACDLATTQDVEAPAAAASTTTQGSANDVLDLLQLVRFGFMSDADRQAVLQHPFTQLCPLVHQCMQDDLQRLRDSNGSTSPEDKQYTVEQRRLVRPAGALGSGPAAETGTSSSGMASAQQRALSLPVPAGDGEPILLTLQPNSSSQWVEGTSQQLASAPAGCADPVAAAAAGAHHHCSSTRGSAWKRCRRHTASSCKELMYVCDGDGNGVIYYIATDYGTKQWVNPVLSKAVEIKASSPPSRYTDPKALVSGQFLNTSFAGPRYIRPATAAAITTSSSVTGTAVNSPSTPLGASAAGSAGTAASAAGTAVAAGSAAGTASTPSSWWQLDLGGQHRLLCNYYTIRHDGSQDGFVRNWVLQGSVDLHHWLDLKRHISDSSIRLPGQFGSWPVTGPAAAMPFRGFRLLLLGPTHSHINPWAFCLSHWELYGYFYKLGGQQPQQEQPQQGGDQPTQQREQQEAVSQLQTSTS